MKSRTYRCGELNRSHVGQMVVLNGWVQRRRDHGTVLFVDVRDRTGITQVVFNAERNAAAHEAGQALRSECVVSVTGTVVARPDESRNANLATGDIEVLVDALEILNEAKTPPFVIEDEADDFFTNLLGHERTPDWCSKEAAEQMARIRQQWV